MHVFLTGGRGIGKSQIIQNVVSLLGRTPYGFLTRFRSDGECASSLHMISPSNEEPLTEENRIAFRRGKGMVLLPERFDLLSAHLLQEASLQHEGIILMDECGHLEAKMHRFHQQIMHILDGEIPILGALRLNQPWHACIKNHPRVKVFYVNTENRDVLPEIIAKVMLQKDIFNI